MSNHSLGYHILGFFLCGDLDFGQEFYRFITFSILINGQLLLILLAENYPRDTAKFHIENI